MISCTDIKPGQCFTWENELYQCIDIQLNKTAMAKMKVKVKVKQPKTGVVKELSFIGSDQVGEAQIDKRSMQYLYDSGDSAVFMDSETYEQIDEEYLEEERTDLSPVQLPENRDCRAVNLAEKIYAHYDGCSGSSGNAGSEGLSSEKSGGENHEI